MTDTHHSLPADWSAYIALLQREVLPALGCTEPVAVALASARCCRLLGGVPERVAIRVSPNIYKNGMGVIVPGTGMAGLKVAAAAGITGGDDSAGLQVLQGLTPEQVNEARGLLDSGLFEVDVAETDDVLYAEVQAWRGGDHCQAVISGQHTRFVHVEKNGNSQPLSAGAESSAGKQARSQSETESRPELSMAKIYHFATEAPLESLSFIQEAARLNSELAAEGMAGDYGLKLGATLRQQLEAGLLSDDLMNRAMRFASAASDARMDGAMLPAMSNSGSGNQGISATMPVVACAGFIDASEEQLIRALILSHLTAIYIKSYQNKLSALCAASTAAMGAGAAITWLLGGKSEQVGHCVNSMVGDVAGIICDGAKASCSLKVSTAASAAVKAAMMAVNNLRVSKEEGIVADSVDQTIANLGQLSRCGMQDTDLQIIEIMRHKQSQAARATA